MDPQGALSIMAVHLPPFQLIDLMVSIDAAYPAVHAKRADTYTPGCVRGLQIPLLSSLYRRLPWLRPLALGLFHGCKSF
jgi:hypothetical protein